MTKQLVSIKAIVVNNKWVVTGLEPLNPSSWLTLRYHIAHIELHSTVEKVHCVNYYCCWEIAFADPVATQSWRIEAFPIIDET